MTRPRIHAAVNPFPGVPKLALNIKETAYALSVSVSSIERLRSRGLLRPIDAFGDLHFSLEEIQRFTREHTGALEQSGKAA